MNFIKYGVRYEKTKKNELKVLGFGIEQEKALLKIPEVIDDCIVTTIGDGAFSDCQILDSVYLPATIRMIGERAFENCKNLVAVRIDNESITGNYSYCIEIGTKAFKNCEKLKYFSYLENLQLMGESVFKNCKSIEEFLTCFIGTLPAKTFENCIELKEFTFIDENMKIDETCFIGCNKLTQIFLFSNIQNIKNLVKQLSPCTVKCNYPIDYKDLEYHGFKVEELLDYNLGNKIKIFKVQLKST